MNTLLLAPHRFVLRATTLALVALVVADVPFAAAAPPLWKQIMPRKRVAADPQADYTLQQENGPWLILAASFTGETGEKQARDLVLEMRSRFNLPAYYYGMTFDLAGEDAALGARKYGGVKRRLQRGDQVVQHAVLVGEFPAIDDVDAQDMLEQLKTMQPKTLTLETEETSQTMAAVREFYHNAKRQMGGKQLPEGPMSHAFLTRNPLLPREFFVPNTVDPEVMKWNRKFEYSLLNCPGRYTIRVATFRGRVALEGAKGAPELSARTRQAKDDDPLVEAGKNAHKMVVALRKKGWEAYEFHDRHESYVTIGGFNDGQQTANGQIVLNNRDAQIIMATFSATTPNNSLIQQLTPDPAEAAFAKQKFDELFAGKGATADGFNPKSIVELPFDIIPQVVAVPRESVSSAYARN
ncbi:MAG: hypothetical protein CMJ58_22365 [Planctomycetaceae bacterium]|nr:hypothetical protein [Planctomycetaceae bacterium]